MRRCSCRMSTSSEWPTSSGSPSTMPRHHLPPADHASCPRRAPVRGRRRPPRAPHPARCNAGGFSIELGRSGGRRMLADVTIVLVARPGTEGRLPQWLQLLHTHPDLGGASVLVGAAGTETTATTTADVLAQACTGHPGVLEMRAPGPAAAANLARTLSAELAELRAALPRPPVPALLGHASTPVALATAYIDHVISTHTSLLDGVSDYLGYLALRAARVSVEWLEPRGGEVEVAVRLNLAGHRFTTRPPWRFVISLVGPEGQPAEHRPGRSRPARLLERVDATGIGHWEWLVARVPLADVPAGDYRVHVTAANAAPSLRLSRIARPSVGALTSSRTVHLTATGARGQAQHLRYLLHTPPSGKEARLRVGRGTGRLADARWTAQLVREDLRYIIGGEGGRRMRMLRAVRLLTAPLLAGREIWLIGERADEAQDNGLHLFRYLRTHHPRRPVYYVLDRSSPQYAKARRLGHVVPHSSIRHQLLMLHAAVLANAHSLHHMLPRAWKRQAFVRRLSWRIGSLQVFLQHGVHLSPEAVKRGNSGYDVMLTSARRESEALRAVSGYDAQIAEVGLPRFDHLSPTPPSRTILVMPTWRRYLPSKIFGADRPGIDPYEGSAYQQFMTGLLTDVRLHRLLAEHDYRLVFLPHVNVAQHFQGADTAGDRIRIATPEHATVQELVRRCDVFVTDHSSVHFDAAYLGTPVVYTQFDLAEYKARHAAASWFDAERDGFGPVTTTVAGTVDALGELMARGCRPDPRYARRVDDVFTYRDRDNSRRVVATIDARLRAIRSGTDPRGGEEADSGADPAPAGAPVRHLPLARRGRAPGAAVTKHSA